MSKVIRSCLLLALALCLSACGGNSDSELTEAPDINPPTSISGGLTQTPVLSAGQFLRNGLYYQTVAQPVDNRTPTPTFEATGGFAGDFEVFSTTNTQEADVDEADRIEFDGDTFYVATFPVWFSENELAVRTLQKQADGTLEEISTIPITSGQTIQGMYLNAPQNDTLSVITATHQYYPIDALMSGLNSAPIKSNIAIDIIDVNDPSTADVVTSLSIEGHLVSSRRIGQAIYLVSAFSPRLPDVPLGVTSEEDKLSNYIALRDTPDENLLPRVLKDGVEQRLYSSDECYIPEQARADDGFSHMVQILKVDLANNNALSAMCAITYVDYIYASSESLYFTSYLDNATQLHKVDLDSSLSVTASGVVPGVAGWNFPHFRLSESNGYLRFVSSDYQTDPRNPFHRLHVLEQQGNDLNIVSMLPQEGAEQGLGKPGEDVYAVRFVGDKGYVVTFERIDPLYVIDLSDPLSPSLEGELEIPGFSNYLHPIGEDYLIGVGQDVDVGTLPENGEEQVTIMPIVRQMKVSLFDVRDPKFPLELSAMTFANSFTPVEYDYRALSSLVSDDYARIAMPIEVWGQPLEEEFPVYRNSLLVLDVDRQQARPELIMRNRINVTEDNVDTYIYAGEDRSVLVGNDVYYLHGDQIWFMPAGDEKEPLGPY